jgi:hypothetical protein
MTDFFLSIYNFITLDFLDFDTSFTADLIKKHEADLNKGLELLNSLDSNQIIAEVPQENIVERSSEILNHNANLSNVLDGGAISLPEIPSQIINFSNAWEEGAGIVYEDRNMRGDANANRLFPEDLIQEVSEGSNRIVHEDLIQENH